MPRTLIVSDGFTSASAPVGGAAGFTSIGYYASTAAFVTAKGSAAANGDAFINSSDNLFYYYSGSAWQTVVLPASAQTLSNKDIDGGTASNTNRITIPKDTLSNLQSLTRKQGTIVYATDQGAFYVDNGTDLIPIGSSSGGTGLNFIENGTFEVNGDGVATYADTAGETPVDGTGGSATLTAARSTSTPLRGDGSLLLTKDAADRQGEGASIDFTLARGYRNQRLSIKFAYEVKSGTFVAGADSDLRVYVYDVTNTTLISPSDVTINAQSGLFAAVFQATASTSYRLIFHVATDSASAWSIAIDDVELGPDGIVFGSALSGWEDVTVTGSWVSNTTYTAKRRRIGDSREYLVNIATSGAPTSAPLTLTIPETIDTSKLSGGAETNQIVGQLSYLDDNGSLGSGAALYGSGVISLNYITSTGSSSAITQAAPFTWAADDEAWVRFTVPISGLSTNLITSNNKAFRLAETYSMTRVTATPTKLGQYRSYLRNSSANTYTETNGTPTATPSSLNGFRIYSGNGWTSADTNNEPSRYEIFVGKNKSVQAQWYGTTGRTGFVDVQLAVYDSDVEQRGVNTFYDPTTGIFSVSCPVSSSSVTTQRIGISEVGANVEDPYFDLMIADAPSIAFGLDEWKAVVALASGDAASASDGNPVICTTVQFDTNGGYNNSTGRYTVPFTGYYRVSIAIVSSNNSRQVYTFKNGSSERLMGTTSTTGEGTLSALVQANAGDILDVRPSGGALDLASGVCYVSFERIGGAS